jgi:hypothetical protein
MKKAASTSETSVNFNQTTRRNNSRRENLKSHMETVCFSERLVSTYESKQRQNPEEHNHPHRLDNLRSHTLIFHVSVIPLNEFVSMHLYHKYEIWTILGMTLISLDNTEQTEDNPINCNVTQRGGGGGWGAG